jgi:hypothetical protein
MIHKTGYEVYLYGDKFWHRTLDGAVKRSLAAIGYYTGEYNQVIEVATGRQMN